MSWYQRWRNVFRADRLHHELEDEFQYHLAETVDRLAANGMPENEAWREARLRLGNYSLQKERAVRRLACDILLFKQLTTRERPYWREAIQNTTGASSIAKAVHRK
jgi:hypothetical protein